jgi:O-antigen ligase
VSRGLKRAILVSAAAVVLGLALVLLFQSRRPGVLSLGTIAFASACLTAVASVLTILILWRKPPAEFRLRPIDLALLACLLWCWASFLISPAHRGSIEQPFLLLTGYSVYLLVRTAGTQFLVPRAEAISLLIVALAGAEAAQGLWQYVSGTEMKGIFFNVNHYAMFLALAVPPALGLAWSCRLAACRVLAYLSLAIFLLGIILSRCRSALAAVVIALGLMILARLGSGKRFPHLLGLLSAAAAVALIAFLGLSFKPLSTIGRILTWKVSARMFLAHPVLGTGYSSFAELYNTAQGDFFGRGLGSAGERFSAAAGTYAFNDYLETAVELGLFGLALFVVLWALTLKTSLAAFRRTGPWGQGKAISLASAGSVIAYLILSLFYYPSRILPIFLLFNFFLAWVVNSDREPAKAGPNPSLPRQKKARAAGSGLPVRVLGLGFSGAAILVSIALLPTFFREFAAERTWARAQSLSRSGQERAALDLCQGLVLRLKANPEFLVFYGKLLVSQGRESEAARTLGQLGPASSNPFVLEKLASVLGNTGDLRAARTSALRASQMLPWRLTSKVMLAETSDRLGETDDALRYALQALQTPMKVRTAEGTALKQKALDLWLKLETTRPAATFPPRLEAILLLPAEYRAEVLAALDAAGDNADELLKAVSRVGPDERTGLGFLLANMSDGDLRTLDAGFLVDQVQLAYEARRTCPPWTADVPEDIFLNYVLPYSVANERRDNWRREFRSRFGPVAARSPSVEDAAVDLNLSLLVQYHLVYKERDDRKRLLSPFETIAAGSVSCGEASMLLVDACRSVDIPSRLVVLPKWSDNPLGHIWVEVYDRGRWHHLVAYDVCRPDKTWMEPYLARLDPSQPLQRVLASSFKRTDLHTTLGPDVSFTDVSDAYRKKSE